MKHGEAAKSSSNRTKPNIMMIVFDDIGYSDLGCYGSEIPTPAMDSVASGGVRFANFHTAPMCSPTRAALLTGRNPHDAGVGTISDWATDAPGYRGFVDPTIPMLPELLGAQGYNCFAVGKWHLNRVADQGPTGPFDQWPTRRGFDRWYGFQGALVDHWNPELFEGTTPVDAPLTDDYHLSADLVDHMLGYVREHLSNAPDRPFFGYLAFGACHWPLHVPEDFVRRMEGRYEGGWSQLRAERFSRQRDLGIIPDTACSPPENSTVPSWEGLSADERRFAARGQEVYAAFLAHTDAQIGRLLDALDDMGVTDDTVLLLVSDNGATEEGGALGIPDVHRSLHIGPPTEQELADAIPVLGSAQSFPSYAAGWAQASNTPFKWYKSTAHHGGIRTPLVIRWPGRGAPGGICRDFVHVSDIVPTLMESLGVAGPLFDGVGFEFAFDPAAAPPRRGAQLFESTGSRALWEDGWKAVTRHLAGQDVDSDQWELYDLNSDFTESNDLASVDPTRLARMRRTWQELAERHQVLPLDDRRLERGAANHPPQRDRYVLYPGGTRMDRLAMPDARRAHRITAFVSEWGTGEGVIVAAGNTRRGYELFVRGGQLHYVYRYSPEQLWTLSGGIPARATRLGVELEDGTALRRARLLVDGEECASVEIPMSWPSRALSVGLRCGSNSVAPVSGRYSGSFPFTGRLHRVVYDMG